MPGPKDYYKILEVDEKADAKTIKSQFRKLARRYHPDVTGNSSDEKFKEINEAYEVLSDPKKRGEYDRLRRGFANRQSRSRGAGFQRVNRDWDSGDFSDWDHLFQDLFSGTETMGSRARNERAVPAENISVTLEQVAQGAVIGLTVQEPEACAACRGLNPDCPQCGGTGTTIKPSRFNVTIPAGVETGTVLRVGNYARLRVEVAPHPRFARQGRDLRGQLMVPVPLAATGGEVSVRPLIGDSIMVKVPPHTNHGRVLRLKGLGLPERGSSVRGDLLLEVVLRFPEPFTAEDDRLYQQLRKNHTETGGEIRAPR